MSILNFRAKLAGFGAILILWGCGLLPEGRTFDIPAAQARQLLLKTDIPYDVLGSSKLRSRLIEQSPSTLVWKVQFDGAELMQFSAELTANDAQSTHVLVSLAGPADGPNVAMGKALDENKTIKNLYLAAMEEEVAAALEKRDFDMMKITPQLLAATGANLDSIASRAPQAEPRDPQQTRATKAREQAEAELAEWNSGESEANTDY